MQPVSDGNMKTAARPVLNLDFVGATEASREGMNIVVLDGFTVNPGDLSWETLESLGPCTRYDRTGPDAVGARAGNAEIVLTNKTILDAATLRSLTTLRYIGVLATGYNVVDLGTAEKLGVVVTNVPAYGTASVAQMTFALLLELTQQVGRHAQSVRDGKWSRNPDFCYWETPLVELAGLSFGIVGYGTIGRAVARIALAFGMRVLIATRTQPESLPEGIERVDHETLFRRSDVVSLHCPLTEATRHVVNERTLGLMKPTAYLLNTGRGPLVDETALHAALTSGQLAGAGLDVLSVEPPSNGNPLINAPHCLVTPHIAWATRASRQRCLNVAIENVRCFLEGTPRNVVHAQAANPGHAGPGRE